MIICLVVEPSEKSSIRLYNSPSRSSFTLIYPDQSWLQSWLAVDRQGLVEVRAKSGKQAVKVSGHLIAHLLAKFQPFVSQISGIWQNLTLEYLESKWQGPPPSIVKWENKHLHVEDAIYTLPAWIATQRITRGIQRVVNTCNLYTVNTSKAPWGIQPWQWKIIYKCWIF